MGRLVVRKAAVLAVSAIVGSVVVFFLLRLLGGDAATIILGPEGSPEAREALRAELGLDRSAFTQYLEWVGGLFRGDLGASYASGYDIFAEIRSRLGVTVGLAVGTLALSWIAGLIAGTYAAFHNRSLRGGVVDLAAQLGIALPAFWAGILLIGFVSIRTGWLPTGGYVRWSESPADAVKSLILPVVALTAGTAGVAIRYTRSSMLEVMGEDYVRTAMAKGRTRRSAVVRHGMRNAAIPLVTVGVLQLGGLLSGVVVVESVFSLPGLGQLLVSAVLGREAVVVQSLAFVIILLILTLNFLMDVAYGVLDPRIRDARGAAAHA